MIVSIVAAIAGSSTSALLEIYIANYYQVLFLIALVLNLTSVAITLLLEDTKIRKHKEKTPTIKMESGGNILKIGLSGAFGSVGLGVVTPIISLYFHDVGLPAYIISEIFTGSYIAAGIAVVFSTYMERFFGAIPSGNSA